MTEIESQKIEIRKGVFRFCAVDNHNHKKGKTYTIIFRAITARELNDYLVEKGVI